MLHQLVSVLGADSGRFPIFVSTDMLGALRRPSLRPFFRTELDHANFERRTSAVRALGVLLPDAQDVQRIRSLVNQQQPHTVVRAALEVLRNWDAAANRDLFERATHYWSPHNATAAIAYDALHGEGEDEKGQLYGSGWMRLLLQDIAAKNFNSPRMTQAASFALVPCGVVPQAPCPLPAQVDQILKNLKRITYLGSGADPNPDALSKHQLYFYKVSTTTRTMYLIATLSAEGKLVSLDRTN